MVRRAGSHERSGPFVISAAEVRGDAAHVAGDLLRLVDPALQVGREKAAVTLLQDRNGPVAARDPPATKARAARAVELVVGAAVRHGVVVADLLLDADGPHRHEPDLPEEPGVRITGV